MSTVLKTFAVYPSDRCGGMEYLDTWAATMRMLIQGSPIHPPKETKVQELIMLAKDVDRLITLYRADIDRLRPEYLIQYALMCQNLAKKPRTEYECEQQHFSFLATRKTLELNFDC